MRSYLRLLRNRPFAALWGGSTVSSFGDALTWVSFVWLVWDLAGPGAVTGMAVAYTAPVILGGFAMGVALDRFDRRRLLIAVNLVLGAGVAAVPVLDRAGALRTWHLYAVAALYGLLKMANWAGVPSLLPSLVAEDDLNTANAMESVSFGLADVAGPAVAGVLIGAIGAADVLAVDAATYLAFVLALSTLPRIAREGAPGGAAGGGLRPAFAFLRGTPAVLATTLMFMAFNLGEGMLLVLLPTFAQATLGGGPATYGVLLSAFSLAALGGSLVVGAVGWRHSLGRSIAVAQSAAGLAFLGLAAAGSLPAGVAVMALAGSLASPLTIWAQTIRMRLIPEDLRGRIFGLLRTLMQSTPPVGGALAGALLAGPGTGASVVVMALWMAVPGLVGTVAPALADRHTHPAEAAVA